MEAQRVARALSAVTGIEPPETISDDPTRILLSTARAYAVFAIESMRDEVLDTGLELAKALANHAYALGPKER